MSWAKPNYDPNTPYFEAQLSTQDLQYKSKTTKFQPKVVCYGECVQNPDECDNCKPDFQDLCSTEAPEILRMLGPLVDTGQDIPCDDPPWDDNKEVCNQDLTQICGVLDGVSTCSLGTSGSGVCNFTCVQNQNWAITDPTNPLYGWVQCVYQYDFTNYNQDNVNNNGPLNFSQWLISMCTGQSSSAPNGMDPIYVNRIRDSNFIYASVLDFYNQMYCTGGFYELHPESNPFRNIKYFESGFSWFISSFISTLFSYFSSLYSPPVIPDELQKVLDAILIPPTALGNNDTYTVSVQLSYTQYQAYLKESDQAGFITKYVTGMLRDTGATITDNKSNQSWSANDPVFINPTVDHITAVQLEPTYLYTVFSVSDWNTVPTKYPNYIFATVQVTVTVSVWSPLLVVYFSMNSLPDFSSNTCKIISQPAGFPHQSTIPVSCFLNDCLEGKTACIQDMENFCNLLYVPPSYVSRTTTDTYLVTNNQANCLCYASKLPPISSPSGGNLGAMCFDLNCTDPNLRNYFNLTDNTCKAYCQEVDGWITSTGSDQSQDAENLNGQYFYQVCGKNITPYTPSEYSVPILITGVAIAVLSGFLVFSLSKYKSYTGVKTVVLITITVLVFLAITIFFGRDMAGLSDCDGKKFTCTSRITKKNIPREFCNYTMNCECVSDRDCPKSCLCASSSCQPLSGGRKSKIVKKRNMNYIMLTISIIMFILFSVSLIYLYKDYHWKISKPVFITLVLMIGIIPVIYYLYDGLKSRSEKVFTGTCIEAGQCFSNADCANGESCVNGYCENLPKGCPIPGLSPPPPKSLEKGEYSIQYVSGSIILDLYPYKDSPAILTASNSLCGISPQVWSYDPATNSLTGIDQKVAPGTACTMIPQDTCLQKPCGGIIYCKDITNLNIDSHFILGQNTIYSIEAQAYLVPDLSSCQTTPCASGSCTIGSCTVVYVTYDTNAVSAPVWTITQIS